MDEIWQRHKAFILQCVVGGLIFLIALIVKSSLYGDVEQIQNNNKLRKSERMAELNKGEAPSAGSITEQKDKAALAAKQLEKMARMVAALGDGTPYVRENIKWSVDNLGMPERLEELAGLYETLPQAGLSNLQGAARGVLVGKAAQLGKNVDESLGITAGVQPEQVPAYIHGLAIVIDVVSRALELDGIDSVTDIKISQNTRRGRSQTAETTFVKSLPIRMVVRGEPTAVAELIRSFNWDKNPMQRMTVIGSIDSIEADDADENTVRATMTLLGLQYQGVRVEGAGQ